VLNRLPTGTQQPVLTVKVGQTIDALYLGFSSDVLQPNQITDLPDPRRPAQAAGGQTAWQTAELLGAKNFALRAWLDPQKLAAYGLTAADVSNALSKQRLHFRPRHYQGPDGAGHAQRFHAEHDDARAAAK